ncbi:MAG TPA: hypothetical protein VFG20_02395 [Planctomycetaceae bacterium]|nr:hypothetical protein [Planctomycetaceae bacterium]
MRSGAFLAALAWAIFSVTIATAQDYLPPNPGAYNYNGGTYAPGVAAPYASPSITGAYGYGNGYGYNRPQGYTATGMGPAAGVGPFWAPGGYEARIGSPYLYHDPNGGQFVVTGNPYSDHYGPGFHRSQLHGHYRFPYYNYRAPWYYPGRAVYNRDTNLHW